MMVSPLIIPGRYQHYKGGMYCALHQGTIEATGEPVVIYKSENEDGRIWVRPLHEFTGTVVVDGVTVARFAHRP